MRKIDNVILLDEQLKTFSYNTETDGYLGTDGIYVEGTITTTSFEAVPFPVSQYDLRLFPQGALSYDDIKIYTKTNLGNAVEKTITRDYDNSEYRLLKATPYKELADLKVYILKRIEGES